MRLQVAPAYGVTPKAIRDIWRGHTWAAVTTDLWVRPSFRECSQTVLVTLQSTVTGSRRSLIIYGINASS